MQKSTIIDLQIIAAVAAAVEAYGQLTEQRYHIININPINKNFSPWRVAGLNDQMRS
jgi:hypothetical protein